MTASSRATTIPAEAEWRSGRLPRFGGPDPDRLAVLSAIDELVRAGRADWRRLPEGKTEVRLSTGQRFRLEDEGIVRTR